MQTHGSSSGLLVKTICYNNVSKNAYPEGVKQNKNPNSSKIQFLEAELDQGPSFVFRDYILQQDLTLVKSLP